MYSSDIPYDMAIAGGGLAGLSLAIQGAQAGYRVVLYEKEQYPYHKVCGEYISLESWDHLVRLGVPLPAWNLPIIRSLEVSSPSGQVYPFTLDMGGFGISRYKLDHALYELAIEAGVTVHTGVKVSNITRQTNGVFAIEVGAASAHARVSAGSFGKRSNLDVKWNRAFVQHKPDALNNYVGVKYHIRYPHPANTIALHNFKNGYCGISQIEDGISCLCYLTSASNLQAHGGSISLMEKEVLGSNPQLANIFSHAKFLYPQPLTISQVSFHRKSLFENEVLMLGDAAGMIAPLCGNGMSMAMHGSKLAFEAMHGYLGGQVSWDNMKTRYTRAWQQQFSRRLYVGRLVQRFFGHEKATSVFLRAMASMPGLAGKLIKSTHGKTH